MKFMTLNSMATVIFASILTAVYAFDISTNWAYMGFSSLRSAFAILAALLVSFLYSLAISGGRDFRNLILIMTHYIFFIPGTIISATHDASGYYFVSLIMSYSIILVFSCISLKSIRIARISYKNSFFIAVMSISITIMFLALYGGMRNFNLNVFAVYEFRRDAAAAMPAAFGYLISGVAKVIVPMALILAIQFRNISLTIAIIFLVILMFGMTHHKSILFLPLIVAGLYYFLQYKRSVNLIVLGFVIAAGISILEIVSVIAAEGEKAPIFTGLIVRRIFFVPPLLDSIYVDYFRDSPKLFWSTSRFGLGLVNNPYDVAAPFLIGMDIFNREGMSANTGVIGSGFSHAGFAGIAIYSMLFGLIISSLQSFGKSIGHEFVFASSVSVVMSILTSSDMTTAVLTHGLLLLFLMLMIFPRARMREQARNETAR